MPIQKAGAIIFSRSRPGHVLLLYRKEHNDWSFPKGWIDEGETPLVAMRREVREETGLEIDNIQPLPDHRYQNSVGDVVVHMFVATSKDDTELRPEFNGDRFAWLTWEAVADQLSYPNLKDYVKVAAEVVERFSK